MPQKVLTGDETEFEGPGGWAKLIPVPDDVRNASENVATWLFFAPEAHPLWSSHILCVIRLREVPGMPPPQLAVPGATHEFGVLALNPEYQPYTVESYLDHLTKSEKGVPYLTPHDACVQVSASDDQAKLLGAYAARAVTVRHLIPDSDYASRWDRALRETLQHIQTGDHH